MKVNTGILLLALLILASSALANTGSISTDSYTKVAVQEQINELDEAHALLVKDQTGWYDSNVAVLDGMADVTYDIINSSSIANTDLTEYTFVIICGDQNSTFNSNVNAAMAQFEDYVDGGGWLQMHFGTNAHDPALTLWDGTSYTGGTEFENDNYPGPDADDSPLLEGMTPPYSGTYANHGTISNEPDDALIIVVTAADLPTTIEYGYGQGRVIASTTPLEFCWWNDQTIGPLLDNMMTYCAEAPPAGPVQFNLIPQTTVIPPNGGNVVYGVELISILPQTVPGLTFWTTVTIPNGQEFGPLTTQPFTHTPNMNVLITNIAQAIPALAPTGTYTFTGSIGFMPNALLDDDFEFEKIGAVGTEGGGVLPNQWPPSEINLKDNLINR